ncbi:M20 family metallopeptidase [Lactococcus protaetiae]|uniref:M20 family metallopeptidase n=1 Tax=Lactococcus protaetiae TaxID=2592653 RepID=A0A514Z7Y2_9LACT|nr:M20 family metallopeptidase [Lactococcus protaetiae]QDK70699.1 M20 family metallopeptidase [Lactococcus protaetiae]
MEASVELLKKLVSIPSASGNEKEILEYIEQWLIDKKFDFVLREKSFVAGQIKAQVKAKKAVIFAGHIDTVVAGNLEDWNFPPTEPQVKDGKIFGLGVSDMKGGDVGNLIAAADFVGEALTQDIWVVGTANEELDGKGSEDFANWFVKNTDYQSAVCIISEPTSLNKIYVGQRGNHFMKLHFTGKAGHASHQEHFGLSALGTASQFLANIDTIAEDLKKYKNQVLGVPSFVATSIQAGDSSSPNKTADYADVVVDCRLTPELEEVFEAYMEELGKKYNFTYENVVTPVLSTLTDGQAPFVEILKELSDATTTAAVGSNDQGFFENIGVSTVVFGPGEHDQGHVANEYFIIENLEKHIQLLKQFIHQMQ